MGRPQGNGHTNSRDHIFDWMTLKTLQVQLSRLTRPDREFRSKVLSIATRTKSASRARGPGPPARQNHDDSGMANFKLKPGGPCCVLLWASRPSRRVVLWTRERAAVGNWWRRRRRAGCPIYRRARRIVAGSQPEQRARESRCRPGAGGAVPLTTPPQPRRIGELRPAPKAPPNTPLPRAAFAGCAQRPLPAMQPVPLAAPALSAFTIRRPRAPRSPIHRPPLRPRSAALPRLSGRRGWGG